VSSQLLRGVVLNIEERNLRALLDKASYKCFADTGGAAGNQNLAALQAGVMRVLGVPGRHTGSCELR
jgi:hypothetical protein